MKKGLVGVTTAAIMFATLFASTAARADRIVNWTGNGLESVTLCV